MIYSGVIQSVVSTDGQRPAVLIGTDPNTSDLYLNSPMMLSYSYYNFSTPGQIQLCGFKRKMPSTGLRLNTNLQAIDENNAVVYEDFIGTGDLIRIYENVGGQETLVFVGYIVHANVHYAPPVEQVLNLQIDSLLSHFTRQKSIQSFLSVLNNTSSVQVLSPVPKDTANTDISSNKAVMNDLVNFLMSQSIYDFAKTFLDFQTVYQKPDVLAPTSEVWYYASTQSMKEEVLRKAIYVYQQVVYQNQAGDLVFTQPSEMDKSSYHFDTDTYQPSTNFISTNPYSSSYNQQNNLIVSSNAILREFDIDRAEASLCNNLVYSLIYSGWFPPVDNDSQDYSNLVSQSIAQQKYFPRSYNLFNSGYFSQVQLVVNSLSNDLITDPTLLNLLDGANFNIPQNGNQTPTIAPLLSSRALAEILAESKVATVSINRGQGNTEIPIGKTFILNNVSYFCVDAQLTLQSDRSGQNVQNVLQFRGVPIRSITGLWSSYASTENNQFGSK